MLYVIVRREDGLYVAHIPRNATSGASYTPHLEEAKTFRTAEAAQKEACGNETVMSVRELMAYPER